MRLEIDGKRFVLTFRYETDNNYILGPEIRETTCTLYAVSRTILGESQNTMGRGTVRQRQGERDCKFLARKYALIKALKDLPADFRGKVWVAYLAKVRMPKIGKVLPQDLTVLTQPRSKAKLITFPHGLVER
jgi:hypothetical protein